MLAHFPRYVRKHLMLAVFQLNPKHSVRQSFQHLCHDFYSFFLRHILSEWSFDAADKLRIIARGIPFAKPRTYPQITQIICIKSAESVNWLNYRRLEWRS